MNISELMKRKVAGVPVLYIAAAFVTILALVAWKMKPTTPPEEAPIEEQSNTAPDGSEFDGLATQGTVTVVQPAGNQTVPDPVVETNETWGKKAIEWLVKEDKASPGNAQTAIAKYLNGEQLSFDEGALRDLAVRQYGIPPESVTSPTSTAERPAQRQFTNFPGTHTIRGTNDATYQQLSQLYYGNADFAHYSKLQAANPTLSKDGIHQPGTVVKIPIYSNPRYFTVTKDTLDRTKIAAKNGITTWALDAYNPNLRNNAIKVGQVVRVA